MPHERYQIPSHIYTFDQHGECTKGPDWICPARPCPAARSPRKLHPLKDPCMKPYIPKPDCCQNAPDSGSGGPANNLEGFVKCEVEVKSDFIPNKTDGGSETSAQKSSSRPCPCPCPHPCSYPCNYYYCPQKICKLRADRGPSGGGGDMANAEGWYPEESDENCCDNPFCFTCLGNCALPKPGGYDYLPAGPAKCRGHCHVACCNDCRPKKERKWPNLRCINPHRNKPCPPKLLNDPCRPSRDPCCEPPQLWKNDPAPPHTPESFRVISLLCTPESSKPVVETDLLGHPDARVADSVRICGICDGARPPPTDWRLGKYDPALSPFQTSFFPDRYNPGQRVSNYKPPCPGPCPCKISTPEQCPESCSPYCPQNTCNPGFSAYPTRPWAQRPNPNWSVGGAQSPIHQIGLEVPQGVCVPNCSPCGPYGPCDPCTGGTSWPNSYGSCGSCGPCGPLGPINPFASVTSWPCAPCDTRSYCGPCGPCGPGPLGPCCSAYPCRPCVPCGPCGPIPNFQCKSTVVPGSRLACGGENDPIGNSPNTQIPGERLAGGGEKVPLKGPYGQRLAGGGDKIPLKGPYGQGLAGGGGKVPPKRLYGQRLAGGSRKTGQERLISGEEVPCQGLVKCRLPQPPPPTGNPWGRTVPLGYLAGPSTNFDCATGPCSTGVPCYEPCDPCKPIIPCNPVNPCRRSCCPVCAPPRAQCFAPSRCRKCRPCCPMVCPGTTCPPPLQRSCRDLEQNPRACQACTDCRPRVVEEEVRTSCKHWREAPNPQYFSVCANQRACCDVGPQLLTEEQLSMFRRCIEHPCYPCGPCGPYNLYGPGGPCGSPCGPCGPCGSPCGPCGPCGSPCGPCGPCGSPCGPCGPCGSPCGPCGPCGSPCGPCGPCGSPCGPCGPCGSPCGPCSPCGSPCGPCGPCGSPCGPYGYPCGSSCYPCGPPGDFCPFPEGESPKTSDDPAMTVCPPGTMRVPGREPETGTRVCPDGTAALMGVRTQDPPREWEMKRRTAVKDLMDPKIPQACYDSSICVPIGYPRVPTRNPNLPPCPPCPGNDAATSTPAPPAPPAPGCGPSVAKLSAKAGAK